MHIAAAPHTAKSSKWITGVLGEGMVNFQVNSRLE